MRIALPLLVFTTALPSVAEMPWSRAKPSPASIDDIQALDAQVNHERSSQTSSRRPQEPQ